MTKIEIKSLRRIVDYYIGDEQLDYAENYDGAIDYHIYKDLLAIENFLKNDNQLNRCPRCGESDFENEK